MIGSRTTGTGTGTTPAPQPIIPGGVSEPASQKRRAAVTGNTQGVIGMSDEVGLSSQNSQQGSVLTSEKNNVKIEKDDAAVEGKSIAVVRLSPARKPLQREIFIRSTAQQSNAMSRWALAPQELKPCLRCSASFG